MSFYLATLVPGYVGKLWSCRISDFLIQPPLPTLQMTKLRPSEAKQQNQSSTLMWWQLGRELAPDSHSSAPFPVTVVGVGQQSVWQRRGGCMFNPRTKYSSSERASACFPSDDLDGFQGAQPPQPHLGHCLKLHTHLEAQL